MKFRNVVFTFIVALVCVASAACSMGVDDDPEDAKCITCGTSTVCNLVATPTSKTFDYKGGSDYITITLEDACEWTATSNNTDWLMLDGAASGRGRAQLKYIVGERSVGTDVREGTITIKTSTQTVNVTIKQDPPPAWLPCDADMLGVYLTLPALTPNRNSNIGISVTTEITNPVTKVKTARVAACSYTVKIISNSPWLSLMETVNPQSRTMPELNYSGDIDRFHIREGNNLSRTPREAVVEVTLQNGKKKQIRIPQAGCVPSATLQCTA